MSFRNAFPMSAIHKDLIIVTLLYQTDPQAVRTGLNWFGALVASCAGLCLVLGLRNGGGGMTAKKVYPKRASDVWISIQIFIFPQRKSFGFWGGVRQIPPPPPQWTTTSLILCYNRSRPTRL